MCFSRYAVSLLVLLGCNRAAAPTPTPLANDSHPSHVHSIVEVGRGVEINLVFDGPHAATATFRAESPLEWNVHSHPDGGVVVHQSGNAADGAIQFRAPNAGTFSFLWKNKTSGPIALDVDLDTEPGVRRLSE